MKKDKNKKDIKFKSRSLDKMKWIKKEFIIIIGPQIVFYYYNLVRLGSWNFFFIPISTLIFFNHF